MLTCSRLRSQLVGSQGVCDVNYCSVHSFHRKICLTVCPKIGALGHNIHAAINLPHGTMQHYALSSINALYTVLTIILSSRDATGEKKH
jgi:hypothetical protein